MTIINYFKNAMKDKQSSMVSRNIIPINQRLGQVDSSHKSIISILRNIENNVVQSRRHKPWKAPRWKTAKITAQHIEEIGLLTRLEKLDAIDTTEEALRLIRELMGYYQEGSLEKETGNYYELFLSETAIALIYVSEYFSGFLSVSQKQELYESLLFISDSLWKLIHESWAYNERTQSRLAWNHSQFVHAVSGICAIKLDNEQSDERLERAILWIEGYLSHSFTWDGFSREGIFYAGATRTPLLLFLMALKEHKSVDLLHHAALLNHHQYLINEWIPSSSKFISRNDINHLSYSTTFSSLLVYAHLYQCDKTLALWETIVGEKGDQTFGNPSAGSNRNGSLVLNYLYYPANLEPCQSLEPHVDSFKVYREAGVVLGFSMKSSFKYSFQASSHLGDIHSQSDHGQIYLYLNGETLLGDTSIGNNRQIGTPGQSEGHNSLLIDGEGMSLSGEGWRTCSILEDASNYGDYHCMRANLTPAYNAYKSRVTLAQYRRLVIVHTKEPYHIIVVDSVNNYDDITHEYNYRFHSDVKHSINAKQAHIQIDAPLSELQIIPLGLDWLSQKQKTFIYKNQERSTYIDSFFSAKDFLGGYVLVPSSKQSPIEVSSQKEKVTISSKTHESTILLGLKNTKYIIRCKTRQKDNLRFEQELKLIRDNEEGLDCLSGDFYLDLESTKE